MTSETFAEQARIEIKPAQATEAPAEAKVGHACRRQDDAGDRERGTRGREDGGCARNDIAGASREDRATGRADASCRRKRRSRRAQAPAAEPAEARAAGVQSAAGKPRQGQAPPPVEARRDSDGLRVTFSFAAADARRRCSAAPTRCGWCSIPAKPIDVEPIRAKGGAMIADVSRLPLEKGQAIRIRLNRPQMPSLTGDDRADGTNWTLTFADACRRRRSR